MRTREKTPSLKDLFREVRTLRREVSLITPTESLAEYRHPKRILASYKKALTAHPIHANHSDR